VAPTELSARQASGAAAREINVLRNTRVLRDSDTLGAERRICLLQWATALGALPAAGLAADRKIRLKLYEGVGDETLPEVHTCSRELHLPPYASAQQLREKLLLALDHLADGFQNK